MGASSGVLLLPARQLQSARYPQRRGPGWRAEGLEDERLCRRLKAESRRAAQLPGMVRGPVPGPSRDCFWGSLRVAVERKYVSGQSWQVPQDATSGTVTAASHHAIELTVIHG